MEEGILCSVLFSGATLQVLMGVLPSHMGDMCVRVEPEEAGGGHEHQETIPWLFSTSVMVFLRATRDTGPTA